MMFWLGFIIGGTIGMFLSCLVLGSMLKDYGENDDVNRHN